LAELDRWFRLTNEPGSLGLSCGDAGVSLAGVPLLRMTAAGFEPRPVDEIGALLKAAYGPGGDKIDPSPGLGVVAEALNQGGVGRAMVAALRLQLPELDWNGAARIAHVDQVLRKYNFDPNEPRDPRGRWTTGEEATLSASRSNDHATSSSREMERPNPPRIGVSMADLDFNGAPLLNDATGEDGEGGPAELTSIANNSIFHDLEVARFAAYLESRGQIVETEVRLEMADGSELAVLDILAKDSSTNIIYGIELKTGERPKYSDGQLIVYPHMMLGESVVALDRKVISMGLLPNEPLPPIISFRYYRMDKKVNQR